MKLSFQVEDISGCHMLIEYWVFMITVKNSSLIKMIWFLEHVYGSLINKGWENVALVWNKFEFKTFISSAFFLSHSV